MSQNETMFSKSLSYHSNTVLYFERSTTNLLDRMLRYLLYEKLWEEMLHVNSGVEKRGEKRTNVEIK